jgi:hypothetical protein
VVRLYRRLDRLDDGDAIGWAPHLRHHQPRAATATTATMIITWLRYGSRRVDDLQRLSRGPRHAFTPGLRRVSTVRRLFIGSSPPRVLFGIEFIDRC